jgi:hypothetical protein
MFEPVLLRGSLLVRLLYCEEIRTMMPLSYKGKRSASPLELDFPWGRGGIYNRGWISGGGWRLIERTMQRPPNGVGLQIQLLFSSVYVMKQQMETALNRVDYRRKPSRCSPGVLPGFVPRPVRRRKARHRQSGEKDISSPS